jgi:hypothetical protein
LSQLNLSAKAYHRILKLARTIADLVGSEHIQTPHLAEALQTDSICRAEALSDTYLGARWGKFGFQALKQVQFPRVDDRLHPAIHAAFVVNPGGIELIGWVKCIKKLGARGEIITNGFFLTGERPRKVMRMFTWGIASESD